jgi:hypothetical protein
MKGKIYFLTRYRTSQYATASRAAKAALFKIN